MTLDTVTEASKERPLFPVLSFRVTLCRSVPSVLDIVVDALSYKYGVREAEVYAECNDRRHQACPQSPGKIANVARKPDEEE